MHESEEGVGASVVTTLSYHETPYEDSRYEVVGDAPGEEVFIPLEISVIDTRLVKADPMFHDFGGGAETTEPTLWHKPLGDGARFDQKRDEKEIEAELRTAFEDELSKAKAEAFEAGRTQGLQDAQTQIEQNNQQVNARVGSIIKDILSQVHERIREIERESIKLVVTLTEKIVPHAVEINPEYILPILQQALGLAETAVIKRVRISPADHEFISVLGLHKSIKEYDGSWEFVSDEQIRAGCVIETSAGEVMFDLDQSWQRVKDNMVKVIR